MKLMKPLIISITTLLLLNACGGSGSNTDSTPEPKPTPEVSKSTVSIKTLTDLAIEKNNQWAKFEIKRVGGDNRANLTIAFTRLENSDITKGSATTDDYQLVYSDGGNVASDLELKANQNSRVIEVRPILDNEHEIPEVLTLLLTNNDNYLLAEQLSAQVTITDAANTRANAKVFLGVFGPQNSAATNASGVLSFIVQGDNEQGVLNYTFSNLGSEQTDQHLHLAPSGTVIKDIESKGAINNYTWDMAPGGIFVNEQQMLDALFDGEFFINIHTANFPHGEISASLNFDENIAPPEETTLTPEDVDRDIIRFLTQATFGPIPEDYQLLRSKIATDGSNSRQVYQAWIEAQLQIEQTSMLSLTDALLPHFPQENEWQIRRDAFWPIALYGKDQLRQRMAFALSEILVVGDDVVTVRNAHRGLAQYWDILASNAFGHYQQALHDVSLHPVMGFWLSHLKNKKENSDLGYFPDENFAREIMQLFSFGLVHRELNGTIKLGPDNLPIPTYDNNVIRQMAKVFTGLSFSAKNNDAVNVTNYNFELGSYTNDYQYRWLAPLKVFPEHHDFTEKQLFTDNDTTIVINESNQQTSERADTELTTVINALVAHKTTAPFISRKLIQRFVTSNPSPDYIERVATAFGSTGDLKATIKAILLDKEARNPSVALSQTFGKVKEPIIQMTSIMRLLNASSQIPLDNATNGLNLPSDLLEHYRAGVTLLRIGEQALGQRPLGSPSVFNFFLPDFSPTGELSKSSLVSPELQLITESQLFTNFNIYNKLLYHGFKRWRVEETSSYNEEQLTVRLQKESFNNIWQNTSGTNIDKATAIVDNLDFYLNAGQLKQSNNTGTRIELIEGIADLAGNNYHFDHAIYAFATVPELVIQK
ncbi:MAG: DUF1800 family protein [Thalassotalea sp.]